MASSPHRPLNEDFAPIRAHFFLQQWPQFDAALQQLPPETPEEERTIWQQRGILERQPDLIANETEHSNFHSYLFNLYALFIISSKTPLHQQSLDEQSQTIQMQQHIISAIETYMYQDDYRNDNILHIYGALICLQYGQDKIVLAQDLLGRASTGLYATEYDMEKLYIQGHFLCKKNHFNLVENRIISRMKQLEQQANNPNVSSTSIVSVDNDILIELLSIHCIAQQPQVLMPENGNEWQDNDIIISKITDLTNRYGPSPLLYIFTSLQFAKYQRYKDAFQTLHQARRYLQTNNITKIPEVLINSIICLSRHAQRASTNFASIKTNIQQTPQFFQEQQQQLQQTIDKIEQELFELAPNHVYFQQKVTLQNEIIRSFATNCTHNTFQ